jgi:WD40 repeat protein
MSIEAVCCAANRVNACAAATRGTHAWACPAEPCGLVACGSGRLISLIAPLSSRVQGVLIGHGGRVTSLAWVSFISDDGCSFSDETCLVSGSSDNSVRMWSISHALSPNAVAGTCAAVLVGHSGPVSSVAALGVDHKIAFAVSTSSDCTLRLWYCAAVAERSWTLAAVHQVRPTSLYEVVALTVAPGWSSAGGIGDDLSRFGLLVAAAGVDCRIHLLGVSGVAGQTGLLSPLIAVAGHTDWVRHIAFPPHCTINWTNTGPGGSSNFTTHLASASKDGKVRVWILKYRSIGCC